MQLELGAGAASQEVGQRAERHPAQPVQGALVPLIEREIGQARKAPLARDAREQPAPSGCRPCWS
jgi:hypothetical protein